MSGKALVLGIRHHGPGSARSVVEALEKARPSVVLIEGPAEASELVPFLLEATPPVAMLFYEVEKPRNAVYYPFAEFSPEMQAIRWADRNGAEIRFVDLPATARLGMRVIRDSGSDELSRLAEAAGFEDIEDWWEHLVEQRSDSTTLFEGLEALMAEIRREPRAETEAEPEKEEDDSRIPVSDTDFERLRENYMRRALAEAGPEAALVCGAWHAPAMREKAGPKAKLPKVKVGATLVPWTYDRLTTSSGYGAGARSPAFYELLWSLPAEDVTRHWLLTVARLVRAEDLDASTAGVIEAVRLAEALASLRGRPRPGLRELQEAAASVIVRDGAVQNLIARRLIVGERMGEVSERTPAVPLLVDLRGIQKRLRMAVDDTDRKLELDLRNENDLTRSRLLHRLNLLGISWGVTERVMGNRKGTFHEHWRIQWRPELALAVVEASPWGNTVETATVERAVALTKEAKELGQIAALVETLILADVAEAIEPAMVRLSDLSATATDVADLADALPPIVATLRYGSVRKTDSSRLEPVVEAIFTRLCLGLPGACASLDDDAADAMSGRFDAVQSIVRVLDDPEKTALWESALLSVAERVGVHRRIAGKAERLRFDLGTLTGDDLAQRLGQEASVGASATETAAFVQGLLEGSGSLLVHHTPLWEAVDRWVEQLPVETFDETLPLIRRTFALFSRSERHQLGERAAGASTTERTATPIDADRAERVVPVVRRILGL